MGISALTGNDTIEIGGILLNDFGDGDVANFTYPNELVTPKTGKNGNSIYAFNETGKQVDLVLRVLVGSPDDKRLNSLKVAMESDFPSFTLLDGNFVKRIGDGSGNVSNVSMTTSGGTFTKGIDGKSNAEGDTEQAIATYNFKFTNSKRKIA